MRSHRKLPHYAVVGAGYAGLPLALSLGHQCKGEARISLINPDTKQELTCDLYRSLRNGKAYQLPFKRLAQKNNVDFIEGKIFGIIPEKSQIQIRASSVRNIHYDKVILATGLQNKYPQIHGLQDLLDRDRESMRKRIFPFKKTIHAQSLRMAMTRIGWGSEKANSAKDNFVVVLGAGATGLEVAGELAALRGKNRKDRIILVDEKTSLLDSFSPFASKALKRKLRKQNIESVLGSAVVSITEKEIHLHSGQVIPWELLVLCSGTLAAPTWAEGLGETPFEKGYKVRSDFSVENHENIYAIGDLAHFQKTPIAKNECLPKRAQFAYQAAKFLSKELSAKLQHKNQSFSEFSPHDLGYLISLGPQDGIARIGPTIESKVARSFSPFIQGQKVDQIKRLIRLNYILQMKSQQFKIL